MNMFATCLPFSISFDNLKPAFRICCASVAVLLVSGCTGAQIEVNRMQKVAAETKVSAEACNETIAGNSKYAPIATKTYFGADNKIPLQMLNDKTSPTKPEIALLYGVYGEVQDCRKIVLDGASRMHPLYMLTLVEAYAESDKLWAEVTAGRLTWGKFNEGRKNISTRTQARMLQADTQISSQLQNQHQFELEQRQRAAAAMQQWSYQQQVLANQQQAINAMNQPRTINCNYFGNTAQCSSQ